jgi:hypothetical protein
MTDSLQLEREATAKRICELEAQLAASEATVQHYAEAFERIGLAALESAREQVEKRDAVIRELTRENQLLKQEEQDL